MPIYGEPITREEANRREAREELEDTLKGLVESKAWSLVTFCLQKHLEDVRDRLATGHVADVAAMARLQGRHGVISDLINTPVGFLTVHLERD